MILSTHQINALELSVTAEAMRNYITWIPYIVVQDSTGTQYVSSASIAAATYTETGAPVIWGDLGGLNTAGIAITAFNDTTSMLICAISGMNTISPKICSVDFWPYYLDQSITNVTQFSASLSAFARQVISNNTLPISPNVQLSWKFIPNMSDIYAGLSGDENHYNLVSVSSISGYTLSASKIIFNCVNASNDIKFYTTVDVINDKYALSPYTFTRNEPQLQIYLNPSIEIAVDPAVQPTYTILSAVQLEQIVPNSTILKWNVDNTSNVRGLTGTSLNAPYSFNTSGSATYLHAIKLSAVDLTNSYEYSLNSFTGTVSGSFRPYNTLTTVSVVTARVTNLPNENNTYKYSLQALGITNSIPHIIDPNQYIIWECDNPAIYARRSDDTTAYRFDTSSLTQNIDNLYIRVAPAIVTTTPKICTANFQLCALSGSQSSDGLFSVYNFSINFSEWLDESYYNPKFRFQYEPDTQAVIYRPRVTTAMYTISNTSKLPPDSFGYITFTFNNGVCSIPYDITNGNTAPSGVVYKFDTTSDCICSISMTVCASGMGYDGYFVREAATKQIVFATIPNASGFKIYPEWLWNELTSTWNQVVFSYGTDQGDVLIPSAPLSAYSICHTENFYLSSYTPLMNEYVWSIQATDDSITPVTTISSKSSAWCKIKTGIDSAVLSVCASVFNGLLSSDMPSMYYDSPSGTRFNNFATTFEYGPHINVVGANEIGIDATLPKVNYIQHPTPNTLYLSGVYTALPNNSLFGARVNSFYFDLSTEFWNEIQSAMLNRDMRLATTELNIKVDDIGDSFLGIPANEKTKIKITPGMDFTLSLVSAHPCASDWCLNSISAYDNIYSKEITAYPMNPVIYNSNRFVLTSTNVVMENLVQCFSGVNVLTWKDRNDLIAVSACSPYITTFNTAGSYGIDLTNNYNLGVSSLTSQNTFPNIVTVQNEYLRHDPNITRIFGFTKLELPHDINDCSMPPNEWVVKDTFNSNIKKLYDNMIYLENMAELYDVPPTDHIGWFGTRYYNNSAARTRWFTNTPQNSYGYNHPEMAIDGKFNNLQSCYVRENTMYISNGTSVFVLSGDFWGTQLGERTYKSIGDDFVNIRSIRLDRENRIYMLDSYDNNNPNAGSKNRVLVFSFNSATSQWQLLYEWGGLGGVGAKNKFNKPSDLYVDANDTLWVADTNNKCIKKYTRTGSWLNTITSDHFTDTEKPISITTDLDGDLYVLTTSQIVKFDLTGTLLDVYPVDGGALKLETCEDGGFIYIVYSDRIVKFTSFGADAGIIALNDFSYYTKDYRDVFHDEFRNLYILNRNHILKYVDLLSIVTLKLNTTGLMWNENQLLVQKDEYIQDWVINRCIQRMWDNLEILRQSLIGKFGYQTFRNVTRTTFVSAQPPPADFDYCNYDWLYSYGKFVTHDIVFEYEKPVVRSFTPSEYKILPYAKESTYIGINELNTADVYNRVLSKLYACEETLLQMIND